MSTLLLLVGVTLAIPVVAENRPTDGARLNRTHVMFEWDQVPHAVAYELELAIDSTATPFTNNLLTSVIDSTLLTIMTAYIDWDNKYVWRVRGINDSGNYLGWGPEQHFYVIGLTTSGDEFVIANHDTSRYSAGYTIISLKPTLFSAAGNNPYASNVDTRNGGTRDLPETMAIDRDGEPIWISRSGYGDGPIVNFFIGFMDTGNFLATANRTAFEIGIDNNQVWTSRVYDAQLLIHHDVFKMPSGNYLTIGMVDSLVAVPDDSWGVYIADSIDFVKWDGDRIIELDEAGNIVWSWNTFVHFSMEDYDSTGFILAARSGFDWTHANSVFFDPLESAIYLSCRHLSRITKIDYPSGIVIWMMGKNLPSGDVDFGWELDFSYQHGVQLLPNGNLLFYDNGNYSASRQSRALEVQIVPSDSSWQARKVWEYVLPPELFTENRGYCKRLENDNTLLVSTTNGYLLEVSLDSQLVWELKENRSLSPYRSQRIKGLYPLAFSTIQTTGYPVDSSAAISYRLVNEGTVAADFGVRLSDSRGVTVSIETLRAQPGESLEFAVTGFVFDSSAPVNDLTMQVTPRGASNLSRSYVLQGYYRIGDIEQAVGPQLVQPHAFNLGNAYPNPFNATIQIPYTLAQRGHVEVGIYDLRGKLIAMLVNDLQGVGTYTPIWNATDFASGIYFVRGTFGGLNLTKKIVLLK